MILYLYLLIFFGFKITTDSDCIQEIERLLHLARKAMTNLNSILKSKAITFPTKVWIVKVIVFPVVMYRRESLTIKKVEHQRIDAFEMWCWRRLFRVPRTVISNQSILKEINPEYSLEGLSLKHTLATWRKASTHWKRPRCWIRLKAKEKGGSRGCDG